MMRDRRQRRLAVIFAVGVMTATLAVGTPSAGATPSVKGTVAALDTATGFVFEGVPATLEPAVYKVELANLTGAPHVLVGVRVLDLEAYDAASSIPAFIDAALASGNPDAFGIDVGAVFAQPGHRAQHKIDASVPGTYIYFCPIGAPGEEHYRLGMVGEVIVG